MINTVNETPASEFKVTLTGIDRLTGKAHDLLIRNLEGKLVISNLINECDPQESLKRVNIALKTPQATLDMIVERKRDVAKELRKFKNMEVPPENISLKNAEIRNLEEVMQQLDGMYAERIEYVEALKQARKILRQRCKK